MISDWLIPEHIQVIDHVDNWQEAISISAQPLLKGHYILPSYIDAIFKSHSELGPYYVLAPGLAMPHARPEQGVLKNGLSLLHIKQGVHFNSSENDPIYAIIMLCAQSGNEHIQMITELAQIFSDEQRLNQLLQASTRDAIQKVIS